MLPMKWGFSMWKMEGSRTVYSRKWDVRHVLGVPRAVTLAAVPWPGLEMPISLSCSAPATHSVIFGLKAEAEARAMVFFLDSGVFPPLLPMTHMYEVIPTVPVDVNKHPQRASWLLCLS